MKFSKDIFKNNYGKPYLNRIKYTILIDAVAIVLVVLFLIANITIPPIIAVILVGAVVLSIFPILPLFVAYYVKALKMSQRQKQWFDGEELHVLLVPEDGFTWGTITTHTKEYVIKKVTNISVNNQYIEILGDIVLIDKYNDSTNTKNVTTCKVPRNFTNDNKIISIGGVRNAN